MHLCWRRLYPRAYLSQSVYTGVATPVVVAAQRTAGRASRFPCDRHTEMNSAIDMQVTSMTILAELSELSAPVAFSVMVSLYPTATRTLVVEPLGPQRTHDFQHIAGVFEPGVVNAACWRRLRSILVSASPTTRKPTSSSRTDFNNNKICYAYDLSRNLETKRVEGVTSSAVCSTALSSPPTGARLISTQWHPDWRLETRIAEPKKLTTITYNGQGATCAPSTVLVDGKPPAVICTRTEQATTDETGAAGFAATVTGTARTWRYTYTTYGRVLTATDPNNRTTTTSYHPDNDADLGKRGNVASITNAANHTTFLTDYNAARPANPDC